MPSITCSACEYRFTVRNSAEGKRIICSKCGEMILITRSLVYSENRHRAARLRSSGELFI
jgi:transcription initiation factor TFIIIB Brf1 subunit/transcription initiation factor TFIIB